jgi:hypothetical protein
MNFKILPAAGSRKIGGLMAQVATSHLKKSAPFLMVNVPMHGGTDGEELPMELSTVQYWLKLKPVGVISSLMQLNHTVLG